MARVEELYDGRNQRMEGVVAPKTVALEIAYVVSEVADSDAALAAALLAIPTIKETLPRKNVILETQLAETVWRVIARFTERDVPPETGESIYSFETGGGTQHITQSLATVSRYGDGAPDLQGAIGFDGNQVQGTDITVPVFTFQEIHYLPESTMTTAYKGTVFSLTGKINQAGFKGLAPGECLFMGASGTKRGQQDWEITFRFAGSPNKSDLMVGALGPISKKGWEYLWIQYGEKVDENVHRLIQQPIGAYVEQVYQEADFSLLGIGV